MKYAKLINNRIEFPPKNKGSVVNYDINYERLVLDGYKELVEAQKPQTNRRFHSSYAEVEDKIVETIVYEETQQEADTRELDDRKEEKILENNTKRDEALIRGVSYKNVLFDSDTDQKVNLLATVSTMGDSDTITWFGMDNQPLECNKADLMNIGGLITQLHSFCWTKNAQIKQEISEAETIEELDEVEINYTLLEG